MHYFTRVKCFSYRNLSKLASYSDSIYWMAIVTPTDRPKSVRNRCEIEVLVAVLCCNFVFLDFSVGTFVIGRIQISSFFTSGIIVLHTNEELSWNWPFFSLKISESGSNFSKKTNFRKWFNFFKENKF